MKAQISISALDDQVRPGDPVESVEIEVPPDLERIIVGLRDDILAHEDEAKDYVECGIDSFDITLTVIDNHCEVRR